MMRLLVLPFILLLMAKPDLVVAEQPVLQIGVAHASGKYHLTQKPFLDEGADQIATLGAKCIKVYLTLDTDRPSPACYPFNMQWPICHTLAELAGSEPFSRLFARPFQTFVCTTFRGGKPAGYWRTNFSPEDAIEEETQFYELTKHLLQTYRGSGKTFVLQNWEGDWAVRPAFDPKIDPTPEALANMTAWFQARQRGIERARAEIHAEGVTVLHCVEVCLLKAGMDDNRPCLANQVVPKVAPDLVSYSCWELQENPEQMKRAMQWLAGLTPDRPPYGSHNIFIGEFGSPENVFPPDKQRAMIEGSLRISRELECPFAIFWQVYCNEASHEPVKANKDVRGFGLFRPDGTKTGAWDMLSAAIKNGL